MTARHVVQIVGDGLRGDWLTWRWASAEFPVGVARLRGVTRATGFLAQALPQGSHALGFDGALTDPARERDLMRTLTAALLPDALRTQLADVAGRGGSLSIRVAPTPNAAAVPWGLLFLDEEHRLLDVADVSWIGPLLPRDLAGPAPDATGIAGDATVAASPPARELAPLHVVDPCQPLGRVLRPESEATYVDRAAGHVCAATPYRAADLSDALRSGVSRLVLIGHTLTANTASTTGFLLSDTSHGSPDALTAAELIAAPGRWPMPPRVAVVACASGVDLADQEPFGLATALLACGADTVQATLWVLPTDEAARRHGVADPTLLHLALAFDEAQASDDPVASLCTWQRSRLDAWRRTPSLATSPLFWAPAMTMTAPERRRPSYEDARHPERES